MPKSPLCITNENEIVAAEATQVLVKENRHYLATVIQVLVKGRPKSRTIDADSLKESFMQKLTNLAS